MSFDPEVFDAGVFGAQEVESCLFDGAVFDSAVFDVCEDAPVETQPSGGGGGGVSAWPGRQGRSWDKWWKKEHAKRLAKQKRTAEKKVERLQQEVRETRTELGAARTPEAIKSLHAVLERVQNRLNEEQAFLDDLEMQEVAMIWALWRQD